MKFKHIAKRYREIEHIKIYLLLGLIFIVFILYYAAKSWDRVNFNVPVIFGVTFSPRYAASLGLNPHNTYLQMFQDLKVQKVRLPAYWDDIEQTMNSYDFRELDFYVSEAHKNNAQVILAIGYKLPRWPECRFPTWLQNSPRSYRQERQLIYIKKVIEHYASDPSITAWQIENEPLLAFGNCDPVDENFLIREVEYVRSLTSKPILLTDSGELSSWITPMRLSDIFGTTMYRTVYTPIIGDIAYPIQPWYYRIKSDLIRKFLAPKNKTTINVELQAEPWAPIFIADIPISQQLEHFTVQNFKNNVDFGKKVGTPEIYLWGVEWWYWVAERNHPEFLEYAKTLFR